MLRSLNWVCLLYVLEGDPGCALIFPLVNEKFSANGGFPLSMSPHPGHYEGVLL
jgi:hypothetical protein